MIKIIFRLNLNIGGIKRRNSPKDKTGYSIENEEALPNDKDK